MTTAYVNICDVCKAEARNDTEAERYKSFQDIKIEFDLHMPYSLRAPSKHYNLCEQCLARIGIVKKATREEAAEQEKSVQDRLYDILTEIIIDSAEIGNR